MKNRNGQKGTVAIIVAVSLPILIGFAGLALDLGRLYVEKTELQNATDACALAASRELTCNPAAGPCAPSFLINAENSGLTVAHVNKAGFQKSNLSDEQISASDIKFSVTFAPNSGYLSRGSGANPASKYVMCTAHQTGIVPWFMKVLGAGDQSVSAQAVASLAPAQSNCAVPLGICMAAGATPADPFANLVVGQWVTSKLSESATGSFDWIDFTPPGGGASELGDLLMATGSCGVPPPPALVGEQGKKTSLGKGWNTRFGLYKGGNTITSAPADFTGYAYTPTSWPSKFNAYGGSSGVNFQAARAQHLPYQGDVLTGLNTSSYSNSSIAQLTSLGADRRLATIPIVDCSAWAGNNPQTVPILGYACALMLHPMDKDNGPSNTDDVWLEYRGKSTDPASPCATSGSVGGPGSVGPLVPALVQ